MIPKLSRKNKRMIAVMNVNPSLPKSISLGSGIYTIPDAALILRLPLSKLRRWVVGSGKDNEQLIQSWGEGRNRAFDFNELIESHVICSLRKLHISFQRIRSARNKLVEMFDCEYPFAKRGLLTDGNHILFDRQSNEETPLLNLTDNGQLEFREITSDFCKKIDFCDRNDLVQSFWPLGKERKVIVNPHHAFGRPVIAGSNITTEAIYALYQSGENVEDIAYQYSKEIESIQDAVDFHKMAA